MKNKRYISSMLGLLLMLGVSTASYGQIIKGKVFGGGQLAQVNGQATKVNGDAADAACSVTISSGSVYGEVYGAGEGVKSYETGYDADVAKVKGDTKVHLGTGREGGGTAWRDVFGGGALAKVQGDTYVSMSGGHIAANLFGGGMGDIKMKGDAYDRTDGLKITSADITGNTNVDITGGDIIWNRTSSTTTTSNTTTTYTYTKTFDAQTGQSATETRETNDQKDAIKASYEETYTEVTVGDPSGDGPFTYAVTYTIPGYTLVVTSDTKRTDLEGYTETPIVEDNSTVEGEIVWWNPDENVADGATDSKGNKCFNSKFYDAEKKKFLIKHNIFGGGYIACRVGTYDDSGEIQNKKDESDNVLTDEEGNVIPTGRARVSMVSGMFGADLMGTQQWKDCYNDNQDPHFYVFGGGFGAYTSVGKTQVQIGVNEEILEAAGETDEQWAKPRMTDGMPRPKRAIGGTSDDPIIDIADQQYGEPGYTVLGVLGGGYAGIVTGNTDVRVGGNTFMHRIYGGGYGQLAAYNELRVGDNICAGIGTLNKNREDLGMVMGNTYVKTDGGFIQGDVFGGGAGVEWDGIADHDFTMGEVKGVTEVEITGATFVQRSVYGGGDVANVLGGTVGTGENDPKQTSTVTVKGGTVVANVFGGGNGRLVSQVKPAANEALVKDTVFVGAIFGNTLVTVEDIKDAETDEIISSPYIYGDIYGGCGYGQIKVHSIAAKGAGDTYVNVNGGNIGGNVYGGGLGKEAESNTSANIAGSTNVTINGGKALWDKISDDNGNISKWDVVENILTTDAERTAVRLALVTGDTQIFKTLLADKVSDKFFDVEKLEYTKNHNIYGGGDRVCKVTGTANVTVNHALVTDATILNPNNSAGLCWAASIDNKEHPQFSVFGGGYGPNTTVANTVVKYQCGHVDFYKEDDPEVMAGTKTIGDLKFTYESQSADRMNWLLYFGGLAQNWVGLDSKEKDEIYGGDNQAGIWRYAVSQLAWSSGIPNLIMRGVFGGGYAGLVSGNTTVTVSDDSCLRYVYGGGLGSKDYLTSYAKDNRNNLYNRLGEVGGNSTVTISGGVVSKEVYGGGAGIEPKKLGSDTDYTDLVDMARVKGKTSVIVSGSPSVTEEGTSGTVIIGDLFGGGDVANVGMEDAAITGTSPNDDGFVTSKVIINSGCMLGQVFAGGNGRTKEICSGEDANHVFGYQKVGAIYGNTLLTVNGYDESSSEGQGGSHNDITYVFKRMFGGGNNGSIRKTTDEGTKDNSGHTYVTVNGGYFAYNVFGGGVGTINITVNEETGDTIDNNTYSYVEGNTHVKMLGGLAIVDQYWDKPQTVQIAPDKTIEIGLRQWAKLNEKDGKKYSAQYDPVAKKLLINHNIYAGCRNAGYVLGNTYLTMNKGYIRSSLRAGTYEGVADNFFESQEWEEIYSKIGSPHFCIFGGGFGENTHIKGDTFVDIDIDATADLGLTSAEELKETDHDKPAAHRFEGGQSVMDIIGGGYSGDVAGATHVKISHDVYARRIFGGSFYAPVSQTNVLINSINCDDIFGGGMMGDVRPTTVKGYTLDNGAGNTNVVIGTPDAEANAKIFINNNVYGGNDVSGEVTGQITASIFGGKIYNNVYGAGNGNYLYALNDKMQKVTAHEYYEANSQTYDLVYEVPLRAKMDFSAKSATDAQKIVNINTYRPMAEKVILNIGGTLSKPLAIDGNVFGGGNTATVSSLSGNRPSVTINIGSHCNIGGVYMGADGEAMFLEKNGFMGAFQNINGVDLTNPIDWVNNVANKSISEEFLPVAKANRNKVYPHVLDLYFEPVEMSVQPTLNWCNNITLDNITLDNNQTLAVTATPAPSDLTNTTIGVFVSGGNRGNMNVEPWDGITANYGGNVEESGQIIKYQFPSGLTITNRIVGGCNEANYTLGKVTHVGGYLLGGREYDGTEINLLVECQFGLPQGMTSLLHNDEPLKDVNGDPVEQRNVYGGCYKSGTIYGDIDIDFRSSMLTSTNVGNSDTPSNVAKAYFASEVAMGNVYGAGYGPESYVYGDTKVTINPSSNETSEYAVMSVYGGGQQGNVIGNTTVRVLNGHLGKSAVGGSYAGYMWGSTQVLVGYPSYYTAQNGGKYNLFRADKWNTAEKHYGGILDVVKREIYLMPGDIVSEEVFNAIAAYDAKNSTSQATTGAGKNFSDLTQTSPASPLTWDNINITIDEAAYGGGYSLASGSSVAAGTYTVKKYDSTMNLDGDYNMSLLTTFVNDSGNNTTKGYGGNSTVLVWDSNDTQQSNDHIKISTQTMNEVHPEEGADLFGYYVREEKNGMQSYRYIYQEGEYFYSNETDKGTQYFQQAYESDSEGGMYGDGHLSFVEGFRTGELVGYGFAGYRPNGAMVINTFQRMDILRIKDCALVVLGARDYTVNEISTTPYSLARIGELHMEAENVTNFGSGTLAAITEKHSRNYLGLSNNIHYVGAVNSNVKFNAKYHYGNKDKDHAINTEGTTTYREEKQKYVDDIENQTEFQKRNDGTAANMIGLSSGYAMKVQNVKTIDEKGNEEPFYGPIVGVIEMNLIDVREDEGGGYVYADNIHHRHEAIDYSRDNYDQVPEAKDKDEDFLETSGNFVFPYDKVKNRYIVDDCFPTGFEGKEAKPEAHYWYVTGFNYYYNAHITGYTYNSANDENILYFKSDVDNLMTLSGAKKDQNIVLQSMKWRNGHAVNKDDDGFVACDLETPAGNLYEEITLDEGDEVSGYYTLVDGQYTPAAGKYDKDETYYRAIYYKEIPAGSLKDESDVSEYYILEDGKYKKTTDGSKYNAGEKYYYYEPESYVDITTLLKEGEELTEYWVKDGSTYVKATGTYDGTGTYYWHEPAYSEDITLTLHDGDDLSSYYTKISDGVFVKASGEYVAPTTYYKKITPGKGNTVKSNTGEHYIYDHYNLHMGTANSYGKYYDGAEKLDPEPDKSKSVWQNLPLTENLPAVTDGGPQRQLSAALDEDSPAIAFQLTDNVDNSGGDYFKKYMAQPCESSIVLTCDAKDAENNDIKGYVPIPYFFKKIGEGANTTYIKMQDGARLQPNTEYYYFGNGNDYHKVNSGNLYYYNREQQRYVSVGGDEAVLNDYYTLQEYNNAKGTSLSQDEFDALPDKQKIKKEGHEAGPALTVKDLISGSEELTLYDFTTRKYTYTIYLTIDYVQGPDVTGNIRIWNCALPGEKIKIDKGTIKINSDVSMSQTSAIWKIGDWRFDQNHPYDPEADKNVTDEMLKDVEYSEQDGCIYVPAYYFMNGLLVQYFYTVNGISQEFWVPSNPQDHLTVHNYHRMKPRNSDGVNSADVDFKLDEAQKRIKDELEKVKGGTMDENDVLPEPRIYIADASDLNELPRFLEEKTKIYYTLDEYNDAKSKTLTQKEFANLPDAERVKEYGAVGSKYDFGKYMQFHLLNDITVRMTQDDHYGELDGKKGTAAHGFKGTLNGNGYVISGFGKKTGDFTAPTYLFDNTTATNFKTGDAETMDYNIYNLGVADGYIMSSDKNMDKNYVRNPYYHCSYTWKDKTVYRLDGTIVRTTNDGANGTYTDNDWRYGKVTYDLNQYYLEARKAILDGDDNTVPEESASGYMKNLYYNGDYLYARWQTASSEYLRSTASQYDANYNSATSYHRYTFADGVLHHPIDESRAVGHHEAVAADPENGILAVPAYCDRYVPLFEKAYSDDKFNTLTKLKNDYLFFGQQLDERTKEASLGVINTTIPEHIDADKTHEVELMANRVYRAGGYYASGKDPYQPADNTFFYNAEAYIHDNGITAIDFHGHKESDELLYKTVVDYRMNSLSLADGVTRNLLVYANNADEVKVGGYYVQNHFDYGEDTSEKNIRMHLVSPTCTTDHAGISVAPNGEPRPQTAYFHLVERTAEDTDASGADCLNNDFDCPVAFDVIERAWYERVPVGYRNHTKPMWEGIALPFTAKKVTAVVRNAKDGEEEANGEITHFYGSSNKNHEYWLRGFVGKHDEDAVFSRPGIEDKDENEDELFKYLFNPKNGSEPIQSYANYTYVNDYFAGLTAYDANPSYGAYYEKAKAENGGQTLSNYVYLTHDIPYIIAFPGNDYYEFSMEGSEIYTPEGDTHQKKGTKQTALFENVNDGSSAVATTIEVTKAMITEYDAIGYKHHGTYLALNGTNGKEATVYGINNATGTGNAFDDDVKEVLPFRTYLNVASYGAAPRRILILEQQETDEEDMRPENEFTGRKLTIEVRGQRVIVRSTFDDERTVNVYRVNGQLVTVHTAPNGESEFTLPGQGIYIINGQKVTAR